MKISVNQFLDKTPNLTREQAGQFKENVCKKGVLTKGAFISEWNDCFLVEELDKYLKEFLKRK